MSCTVSALGLPVAGPQLTNKEDLWQIAYGLTQDFADEMEGPCSNVAACLFVFLGCVVLPVLLGDLFAAFSVRADCLYGVWRWALVHGGFGCGELGGWED
jgi:hypothetical protein